MTKKTYIKIEGQVFIAELQEDDIYAKNHFDLGRLFRIIDKKGEVVGCISTFISMTTKAIWNTQKKVYRDEAENLFLRILPHVNWKTKMEEMSAVYPSCVPLYIHSTDTGYDENDKVHYVRGYESTQELVNNLIFNGDIDEEKIERDILTYLHAAHLDNHLRYVHTSEITKALFVDKKLIYRCLNYILDDGYIMGDKASGVPEFILTMITTTGVRYVRSNFKKIYAGKEIIIMGDYIGNDKIITSIDGDNNKNIVKSKISNSFNINVVDKVNNLRTVIQKDYHENDKKELLEQLDRVEPLSSDKKNFPKIREILGNIMTKTAKVATIGSFCLQALQLFIGGN